jgi:hypothetical protein
MKDGSDNRSDHAEREFSNRQRDRKREREKSLSPSSPPSIGLASVATVYLSRHRTNLKKLLVVH